MPTTAQLVAERDSAIEAGSQPLRSVADATICDAPGVPVVATNREVSVGIHGVVFADDCLAANAIVS